MSATTQTYPNFSFKKKKNMDEMQHAWARASHLLSWQMPRHGHTKACQRLGLVDRRVHTYVLIRRWTTAVLLRTARTPEWTMLQKETHNALRLCIARIRRVKRTTHVKLIYTNDGNTNTQPASTTNNSSRKYGCINVQR